MWLIDILKNYLNINLKGEGNVDRSIDLGGIISGLRKGSVAISLWFGL